MTFVSTILSQASVEDPPADHDGLLVENLAMQSLWYLASAACKSLTAKFALNATSGIISFMRTWMLCSLHLTKYASLHRLGFLRVQLTGMHSQCIPDHRTSNREEN